ncbi:MAG: ABC transporter permease subunit, partial [Candidatus Omnitrophota bacterium]|nr:ABC transporter permease subunit [Candidatus Omnitrophota bacterium]
FELRKGQEQVLVLQDHLVVALEGAVALLEHQDSNEMLRYGVLVLAEKIRDWKVRPDQPNLEDGLQLYQELYSKRRDYVEKDKYRFSRPVHREDREIPLGVFTVGGPGDVIQESGAIDCVYCVLWDQSRKEAAVYYVMPLVMPDPKAAATILAGALSDVFIGMGVDPFNRQKIGENIRAAILHGNQNYNGFIPSTETAKVLFLALKAVGVEHILKDMDEAWLARPIYMFADHGVVVSAEGEQVLRAADLNQVPGRIVGREPAPGAGAAMIPALTRWLRKAEQKPAWRRLGFTVRNQGIIEQVMFWALSLAGVVVLGGLLAGHIIGWPVFTAGYAVWSAIVWGAFIPLHVDMNKGPPAAVAGMNFAAIVLLAFLKFSLPVLLLVGLGLFLFTTFVHQEYFTAPGRSLSIPEPVKKYFWVLAAFVMANLVGLSSPIASQVLHVQQANPIGYLITFFPMVVNATVGLKSVDRRALDLMHVLRASEAQVFYKLRIPASLPFVVSALKISAPLAVVGSIVAEIAGASTGIGYLILIAAYQVNTPFLFACIV